jgi:hypothetical protein
MSRLEAGAKRTLAPFILGETGEIESSELGAAAAWAHKTALTSMLISSKEERAAGHGVPAGEYRALYELREATTPPDSQFWIGQYAGAPSYCCHVTPVAIRVEGMPEPDQLQGYAMTIVVGQLLIQGVRFTTPTLAVAVTNGLELPQIWPPRGPVRWPGGTAVDDTTFLAVAAAKNLRSAEPPIQVRAWTPATELARSRAVGQLVELPTICGKHVVYYPASLVAEAMRGRFYSFVTGCECPMAYLIQTEGDGAHCKAAGSAADIALRYEDLPGEECEIHSNDRLFFCKLLPSGGA